MLVSLKGTSTSILQTREQFLHGGSSPSVTKQLGAPGVSIWMLGRKSIVIVKTSGMTADSLCGIRQRVDSRQHAVVEWPAGSNPHSTSAWDAHGVGVAPNGPDRLHMETL